MARMDSNGDVVRAFAVGAALLVLWLAMAWATMRLPRRRTAERTQRWLYDLGARVHRILALTPVVFAVGWPVLWWVGVAGAGWVALLGAALTVAPVGVVYWWTGPPALSWVGTAPVMYAGAVLFLPP
jgi:hypothetical protein